MDGFGLLVAALMLLIFSPALALAGVTAVRFRSATTVTFAVSVAVLTVVISIVLGLSISMG